MSPTLSDRPPLKNEIASIQILRGIAALLVVFFHYNITLRLNPDHFVGAVFAHGWAGVDLFFVISGFIAAYTVSLEDSGWRAAANYLLKRFIRIVPLYYLITLCSVGHSWASFVDTLKSLLFIPLGGVGEDGAGPLYGGARVGQGWTLNYEIYFYLIVSLSFFFGRLKWLFVVGTMGLLLLLPLVLFGLPASYGYQGFQFSWPYISMMTNPIIIEFILGLTVYYIFSKMSASLNGVWLIAITCLITFYIVNLQQPFFTTSRVMQWGVPSALLIIALLKLEQVGKLITPKILMYLGNISFSIYLLHDGTNKIIRKLAKRLTHDEHLFDNFLLRLLAFIAALAVTIALSSLTYKYIEKKQSDRLRKFLPAKA